MLELSLGKGRESVVSSDAIAALRSFCHYRGTANERATMPNPIVQAIVIALAAVGVVAIVVLLTFGISEALGKPLTKRGKANASARANLERTKK